MPPRMITNIYGIDVVFRPNQLQCWLLENLNPNVPNLVVKFRRSGAHTMIEFIKQSLWPELEVEEVIGGPGTDWEYIEGRGAVDGWNVVILPCRFGIRS